MPSPIRARIQFLLIASFLWFSGCVSTQTPERRDRLQSSLSEKERIFAVALLAGFDLNEKGTVYVGIDAKPVSRRFLTYVNATSPVLRFANPDSAAQKVFGLTFNLAQIDYFYPGYVYLGISYIRCWNGRGETFGVVLKKGTTWSVVDTYRFEEVWHDLDRAAYIRERIQGTQRSSGTPTEPLPARPNQAPDAPP